MPKRATPLSAAAVKAKGPGRHCDGGGLYCWSDRPISNSGFFDMRCAASACATWASAPRSVPAPCR